MENDQLPSTVAGRLRLQRCLLEFYCRVAKRNSAAKAGPSFISKRRNSRKILSCSRQGEVERLWFFDFFRLDLRVNAETLCIEDEHV